MAIYCVDDKLPGGWRSAIDRQSTVYWESTIYWQSAVYWQTAIYLQSTLCALDSQISDEICAYARFSQIVYKCNLSATIKVLVRRVLFFRPYLLFCLAI